MTDGVAFVTDSDGSETRVRWRFRPLRWRCDAHPGQQGCDHMDAVQAAYTTHQMTQVKP